MKTLCSVGDTCPNAKKCHGKGQFHQKIGNGRIRVVPCESYEPPINKGKRDYTQGYSTNELGGRLK